MRRLGAVVAVWIACASVARASTADVFGLGSAESGVGGASAARVADFSAGYYDPAGLVGARRPEATVGLLGFGGALKIRSAAGTRTTGLTDPIGILVGAATPLPFTGWLADRLYLGVALYILPDTIVRIIARRPDEAFFPLYDNRTQRLIVLPALAARLGRGVALGIGFNYLAGLDGRVSAAEGATRAIEARVDEAITSHLAVNAAVRWQATREWAVALVYRQQFGVPFRTVSRNTVAGQPIDLDVDAEGLFTPHTLIAGAAWSARRLVVSLDVGWARWSDWRGPFVTVASQLPLIGPIDAAPPRLAYRDTGSVRAGLEWAHPLARAELRVRGGYGFESSPLPADQPGVTNLLDGPKHRLALGLGVRIPLSRLTLRLDAHGQLEILQPSTLHKTVAPPGAHPDPAAALADANNPGYPTLTGSGLVWAAGFTFTVQR